jgi:hypothetical protein
VDTRIEEVVAAEHQQQGVALLPNLCTSGHQQKRRPPSMGRGINYLVDRGGTTPGTLRATAEPRTVGKSRRYLTVKDATSITTLGKTVIKKTMSVSTQKAIGA